MSVDMTKWQEIAKEKIHSRPAGTGRLAGKITIVTGAAQGFQNDFRSHPLYAQLALFAGGRFPALFAENIGNVGML